MTFKKMLTIPDDEDQYWDKIEEEYDDFFYVIYEKIEEKIIDICELNESGESHIGGYDKAVQSSVFYDFAATDLIDIPSSEKEFYTIYQEKWETIKSLSGEYSLICQVDTGLNNTTLYKYLDSVMYIGIRNRDLEIKNFNNLILVFQNT